VVYIWLINDESGGESDDVLVGGFAEQSMVLGEFETDVPGALFAVAAQLDCSEQAFASDVLDLLHVTQTLLQVLYQRTP